MSVCVRVHVCEMLQGCVAVCLLHVFLRLHVPWVACSSVCNESALLCMCLCPHLGLPMEHLDTRRIAGGEEWVPCVAHIRGKGISGRSDGKHNSWRQD